MNKTAKLFSAIAATVALASCSGGSGVSMERVAAVTDSIVTVSGNASAKLDSDGKDVDATFTVRDVIDVDDIDQALFDVLASQYLKALSANDINLVADGLRDAKGKLKVTLADENGDSKSFELDGRRIIELQRAKLSGLDRTAALDQIKELAEDLCPNPEAHTAAEDVEVSVNQGFLVYTVIWRNDKAYANDNQSLLTKNYYNALKIQYQRFGDYGPWIVDIMKMFGIDGVRMVYASKTSDKTIKQAFTWNNIAEPITAKD